MKTSVTKGDRATYPAEQFLEKVGGQRERWGRQVLTRRTELLLDTFLGNFLYL